jgi:membrane protein DedA with SNARE-associated domain
VDLFLEQLVAGTTGWVAYAMIFGILLACGLGVPLPEDISLILGGYLAYQGNAQLSGMMAVGFFGILVGDSLIYLAGRRLGTRVGTGKGGGFFARVVTPEKRARVEHMFARHGRKVVMIARFMPGVRAVTYFTAGSVRMSYWRFIFWDGLAAILSAPLFVYAGYHFGGELDLLKQKLKEGQVVVFGSLAALAVAWWLFKRVRDKRLKARAAGLQALQASSPQAPGQPPSGDGAAGRGGPEARGGAPREGVPAAGSEASRPFGKPDALGPRP